MIPSADVLDADLLRELRYCAVTPGARFFKGQIAAAQDRGLEQGLLERDKLHPDLLAITPRGRRLIQAADRVEQR